MSVAGGDRPAAGEPPVACSLNAGALRDRRCDLGALLRAHVHGVEALDDGYSLRLDGGEGTLVEVARLVELERACCRFLRFRLTVEPALGPVTLELTGPPGTRALLRELLALPA